MMNEYEKMAKDFLKSCGAKMSISFKTYGKHFPDDKENRNIYTVRIDRNGKTARFTFGDSINNTNNGERPTCYDVLACLTKYDVGSIDDFISDFGYEINSYEDAKKVEKTYKAVKKEFAKVYRLFNDVMDQLCEIW